MDRKLALLLFLTSLAAYLLLMRGFDTSEGMEHFALARHLVAEGKLGYAARTGVNQSLGLDGAWYNIHDAGNTFAMLPVAGALELASRIWPAAARFDHLAINLFSCVVAAAIVAAAFALFRALGARPGKAALASLLLAFATQLWPYSREASDGLIFTFCVTAGTAALAAHLSKRRDSALALAGSLFGFSAIVRAPGAVWCALALFAVFRSASREKRRDSLVLIATLLPFALWQAWYNWIRSGNPLLPAMAMPQVTVGWTFPYAQSIPSLLISPGCGAFLYEPVLILSVLSAKAMYRESRRMTAWIAAAVAIHFLIYAGAATWTSYSSWGPRYLLMILPFLMAPLAFAELPKQRSYRWVAYAVVAASVGIQLLAVWVDQSNLIFFHMRPDLPGAVWRADQSELLVASRELPHVVSRDLGIEPPRQWPQVRGPRQLTANYGAFWFVFAHAMGMPRAIVGLLLAALTAAWVASARALKMTW